MNIQYKTAACLAMSACIFFSGCQPTEDDEFESLLIGYIAGLGAGAAAATTAWVDYSLTIDAVTTAPTKATAPFADSAEWRRVGDSMEIVYNYEHTANAGATAGTGTYLFCLPAGFSIDSNKIHFTSNANIAGVVGAATYQNATATYLGNVMAFDSTGLYMFVGNSTSESIINDTATFNLANATVRYSFRATVPIAGW